MDVPNLTYIDNLTYYVRNNDSIVLFAILTDDMGNNVTWGNITFHVNGLWIGSIISIGDLTTMDYLVDIPGLAPVNGIYTGNGAYSINILPDEFGSSKWI